MAYLFNGATHTINRADAVLQSWPITMHGRIRLTSVNDGLVHCIMGMWEAGADNGFRLQVESVTGVMKARCGSKASGAASNANTSTSIGDTNWHSVVGEISAANARQVWLDNGGNGTNATSLTPGTLTKTSIGAHDNGGTLSGNLAHELADIAVWAGTLTNEERAALAAGISPALIRPDILKLYLPLIGGGTDQRGANFTVTGATVADHPRVYMPARATFVPKTTVIIGSTGASLETDTALALTGVQILATGAGLETDAALGLGAARPAGLATESDSALALTSGASAPVGQSDETDTSLTLAGVAIMATGLAVETETALALSAVGIRAVGVAVTSETSLPLGSARPATGANDNETALALAPVAIQQCGTALETETALSLAGAQLRLVGVVSESDTAFALSSAGTSVGIAFETDMALALQGSNGSTPPDRRIVNIRDRSIVGNARGSRTIVSATRKAAA